MFREGIILGEASQAVSKNQNKSIVESYRPVFLFSINVKGGKMANNGVYRLICATAKLGQRLFCSRNYINSIYNIKRTIEKTWALSSAS